MDMPILIASRPLYITNRRESGESSMKASLLAATTIAHEVPHGLNGAWAYGVATARSKSRDIETG